MDYKAKLSEYKDKITKLSAQSESAKTDIIILESNLKQLVKQKEALEKECIENTGVSIDELPSLIQEKQEMLDKIMEQMNQIDIDNVDDIEKLNEILNELNG